jgi:hypothetical protein
MVINKMIDKENFIQVNVYMPRTLLAKIDKDRGDLSRSGYLATMAEIYFEELENYEQHENAPQM